jgi:hypothetical protein
VRIKKITMMMINEYVVFFILININSCKLQVTSCSLPVDRQDCNLFNNIISNIKLII